MAEIFQYSINALAVLAIVSYGYGQLRKGRNDSRLDTITILEKDVKILKDKVVELTAQVDKLQLTIQEKDQKLMDALAILQGRNPEMDTFIKLVDNYITGNAPLFEEIRLEVIPVARKLDKYLNKQSF